MVTESHNTSHDASSGAGVSGKETVKPAGNATEKTDKPEARPAPEKEPPILSPEVEPDPEIDVESNDGKPNIGSGY